MASASTSVVCALLLLLLLLFSLSTPTVADEGSSKQQQRRAVDSSSVFPPANNANNRQDLNGEGGRDLRIDECRGCNRSGIKLERWNVCRNRGCVGPPISSRVRTPGEGRCRRTGQVCNNQRSCCDDLECYRRGISRRGEVVFRCSARRAARTRSSGNRNRNNGNSINGNVRNKIVTRNRNRRRRKDCVGENRRCKGQKGKRCCNPLRCNKATNRCSMPGLFRLRK